MKVAIITDTHSGAGNDSHAMNEYFLRFYEEVFFPHLKENGIKNVIHLGDTFDRRKYINFNTLHLWQERVFKPLHDICDRVDVLIGNHDTYYKNTNSINSVQELLSSYTKFKIYPEPTEVSIGGMNVLYLPWICEDNTQTSMRMIADSPSKVCMGHLEIIGFEMYAGHLNVDKGLRKDCFDKFFMTLSGHFHQKSSLSGINYLGSPYPMMWGDYGCMRGFHILDTETLELKFIENPLKIFHKVYYDDSQSTLEELLSKDSRQDIEGMYIKLVVQKKDNPYWFDQYLENLQKYNPCDISIIEAAFETLSNSDETLDETKDTLTILKECVNSLETGVDKKELNELLRELYAESLNTNEQLQGSG